MATMYKTPGVYIEEIPKFPPSIAPVETAIPAFIGYTQIADDQVPGDLLLKPKRIASMVEYETHFGFPQPEDSIEVTVTEHFDSLGNSVSFKAVADLPEADRSKHILYYAMQSFFANGGGPCYIVSAGPYKANVADSLVLSELEDALDTLVKEDEPTLILCPEAQFLDDIADFKSFQDRALLQCETLKDRFVVMDVHGDTISLNDPGANLITAVGNFRSNGVGTNNLKYGAAYGPNIETVFDYVIDEATTNVVYNAINNGVPALPTNAFLDTLVAGQNVRYSQSKAAIRSLPLKMPPSASIAGIYAATDNSRGVWKAPANVSVNSIIQPTIQFSNVEQDVMNVDATAGKSVNAIRAFVGKGSLVWGARTLAGNDLEWRYVPVRRLFNFVEESVKKATEQFVFEPNDANTWVRVQAMIENFLNTLWRQGALQGIKPEHAFYVAVGLGKTMTAVDILEGRMIVEIGMAAVRPAEFIVLRFSHKLAES